MSGFVFLGSWWLCTVHCCLLAVRRSTTHARSRPRTLLVTQIFGDFSSRRFNDHVPCIQHASNDAIRIYGGTSEEVTTLNASLFCPIPSIVLHITEPLRPLMAESDPLTPQSDCSNSDHHDPAPALPPPAPSQIILASTAAVWLTVWPQVLRDNKYYYDKEYYKNDTMTTDSSMTRTTITCS